MSDNNEGDLQVWWIPQIPGDPFTVSVSTVEMAAKLLTVLAEYDAFQYAQGVKPDYCNAGGLCVWEDGEWCDWQDEETGEDDPCDAYPQPGLGWCSKLNDMDPHNGRERIRDAY